MSPKPVTGFEALDLRVGLPGSYDLLFGSSWGMVKAVFSFLLCGRFLYFCSVFFSLPS